MPCSTGRSTNILLTVAADPSKKPTTWPQYNMGPKALPEANRDESCYPPWAEDIGVKILHKGWQKDRRRRKLPQDLLWDQNVSVTMRDGVKLQLDVFRSLATQAKHDGGAAGEKVPTILMYGPYGKSGAGPQQLERMAPFRLGLPFSTSSGLESFEGMDPAEWIPRGYAIVNCDSRGSWKSQGNHWAAPDRQAGIDGYDVIEWIASQQWSSGKVVMAGNSRLSTVQYFVAAERPPSLACIAPWEGIVDEYRSHLMRGGRPGFSFNGFIIEGFYGTNKVKDLKKDTLLPRHQYDDDFWAHLRPDISRIEVPMYVVASYSTGLHSVGSVHIFRDAPMDEKWLRFHDAQEWFDIADKGNLDNLQAFYDAYALIGEQGIKARRKWESKTPRVRNCILPFGPGKRGLMVASETYPPPTKASLELFLDSDASLKEGLSFLQCQKGSACYDSGQYRASTHFDWKCNRRMVLCGMPKVVLHASPLDHSTSGDEMDIVILLRKLDKTGQAMVHLVIPLEAMQQVASEINVEGPKSERDIDDVQTMKQYGSHGIMRLSHRSIAKDKDGNNIELIPGYPHHSHTQIDVEAAKADQIESFKKGRPVAFETGLWPIGMLLEEGEGLRLEIGGNILWAPEFEMLRSLQIQENENRGMHQIHFGSHVVGEEKNGLGPSRIILPLAALEV